MVLADVSIKRPVFTIIVMALLMLFGAISFKKLGVDLSPKVESPYVTISTVWGGADPEVVENRILKPIEDAVSAISGVKTVTSTAVESFGVVAVEFHMNVKADRAAQDVRDRLSKISRDLPSDAEAPVIEKVEFGAGPVVSLVLVGPKTDSAARMTWVSEQRVRPQLQRLDGVGVVDIIGKQTREIQVIADPGRLRTFGLTLSDLQQVLAVGNSDVPGGHVTTSGKELLVKTHGEATSIEELRRLVVTSVGGAPVLLGEVAQVVDSAQEARSLAAYDGEQALTLFVRKQSDANSVAVSEKVLGTVAARAIDLPDGYRLEPVQNSATYTRNAINSVVVDLILGGLLAVAMILLFLRDARATFISALALPTSVVGTFAFMQAMGFTMNNMTMLALSLSIGMLIDDAIVVIENIYRHMEAGKPPMQAAREATAEIGLAVLATTFAVIAVFVPVALMDGMVGRMMYEFGLTVAIAMLISLFVSFTLTPMASSRLLAHHQPGKVSRAIGAALDRLDEAYRRAISWVLGHRLITAGVAVAALVAALGLATRIPTEMQPSLDQGELEIAFFMPEGTSLEATYEQGEQVTALARESVPELRHTLLSVGTGSTQKVNEGTVFLKLANVRERARGQDEIAVELRRRLAERLPKLDAAVSRAASAGSSSAMWRPLNIELSGEDMRELRDSANALVAALYKEKGFVDLTVSDRGARPQLGFSLDREKLAAAGLAPLSAAAAVRTAINGTAVSQFRDGADRYEVVLKAPEEFQKDPSTILSMPVRGARGTLIEIGELASARPEDSAAQINRVNRSRLITIVGNLDGVALGDAKKIVDRVAKQTLPASVKLAYGGQGKMMAESFKSLAGALLLAIALIYMVLAAQFESFLHPFTIMISLPLSMVGALGGLLLAGQTLSIMSIIGIIMLMGLVTKNAILLVDNANQHRDQGASVAEALAKAGVTRLRPILMTTAAMVFGMVPVAAAMGEGSEQRAPMGVAVIGGLITSTLLTLFVVPVVYSAIEGGKARMAARRHRRRLAAVPMPKEAEEEAA